MPDRFFAQVGVMAVVTYLIRAVPLVVFRGQLENRWLKDFLFYAPYAVLGAMTFPAVFSATGSPLSAACGVVAGVVLASMEKGLLTVAAAACTAVLIAERLMAA